MGLWVTLPGEQGFIEGEAGNSCDQGDILACIAAWVQRSFSHQWSKSHGAMGALRKGGPSVFQAVLEKKRIKARCGEHCCRLCIPSLLCHTSSM